MKTVYKYSLNETHKVPHSWKFVHAGRDPTGVLCFWLEVDTSNSHETIMVAMVDTGKEIPRGGIHLFSMLDGPFMWHFYAVDGRA